MRVVLLLLGLCIAHLGVTLFLQTDLGSDPFNVFIQGLYRALPWPAWAAMTHGRVHLLVSLLILVALLVIDRSYVGIGTVLCMALGGPIIDLYTLWLAPFVHPGLPLPVRLGLLVAVVSLYTHFQLFTDLAALTGEEPAAAHLAPGLLTIRTVLVVCQTALYCTDLFLRLPWLAVCVWLLDLAAAVAALVHLGKLRRALAAPPQAPAL